MLIIYQFIQLGHDDIHSWLLR